MMRNVQKMLVASFLITASVVLPANLVRGNAVAPVSSQYDQLKIGDVLFGKSQTLKLKLFGSAINFDGKVLKTKELKGDEIVVYRIVIFCCTADGVPLGIVVKMPAAVSPTPRDGDWVKVTGFLKLVPLNPKLKNLDPVTNMTLQDQTFPYLVATKVAKVKTPGDQYLYP